MPDWNTFFVFIVIAIALLSFGFIVDQGYAAQLNETSVTNETLNITEFNTPLNLTNSNIDGGRYDNTTTVYNATDVELTRSNDYRWLDHNGTINFSNTANTSLGMDVKVSYTYHSPDEFQLLLLRVWAGVGAVMPWVMLVMGVTIALWILDKP